MAKKEHIVVGLDIGTTKICAVVGEILDDRSINVIGVGSHRSTGLRKGMVVNMDSTVESIKRAVEEAELMAAVQINSVYTGIAGSHIGSESAQGVVALKKREVTKADVRRAVDTARGCAVPAHDRQILHVLPREFIVDDQEGIRDPLGIAGSRLEVDVHIVTGAVTSAQNLVRCVSRAGVDIGGGTTDIAIFVEGCIRHSAVIPIGGNQLTGDLAMGLKTAPEEAEKIKLKYGVASSQLLNDDERIEVPSVGGRPPRVMPRTLVAQILSPRVEEMFDLVLREIRRAGYDGMLVAGGVLTGGTSLLPGMAEVAEQVLNLSVRLGKPIGVGGLREIVSNPSYSTAVGLIVHSVSRENEFELVGPGGGKGKKSPRLLGSMVFKMKGWIMNFF
jgi:cell division protein FtsA